MRTALSSVLVFMIACGSTPPASAPSPAPVSRNASSVVTDVADAWTQLCAGPESVPMEVAGSREFVMVTLPGGKAPEPVRFHVDTGGNTPGLLLNRSVAERLGFASVEALPRSIRIGDREMALPDVAHWMLVDDAGDDGRFDRAARGDFSVGQLGAGFLSRFVVCIDPGRGRLGLGDPKRFDLDPRGAKWVPLFMVPGGKDHALYPFVRLGFRERGVPAGEYGVLLDTGATTSMLDRKAIEGHRKDHPSWPTANGAFGDADMIAGQYPERVLRVDEVAIDSVDVGPTTFVDRPTGTWANMFGDVKETGGSHGVIANDALLRFRLLVDYPHARLFVQPSGRQPDASASSSRIGLAVAFGADGCPAVRQITDTNDKVTRERIAIGDVLLAVDGQETCKRRHHEIAAALAGPAGAKKKLRLRRGEATLEVEGVSAELLGRR